MIENLNRFVAYVCPSCSGISDKTINIFDFSGTPNTELSCSDKVCKCQAGTINMKNDKMKIMLRCPVCTENHTFSISKSAFWSRELITFDCTNSGITIFFAGEQNAVIEAVNENEKIFEAADENPESFPEELKIILRTLDALHVVMDEKRMICKCGSRNLFPVFDSDTMYVECEDCKQKFPIKPSAELLNLLSHPEDDFKL